MDDKKKFVGAASAAIIIFTAFVNIAFAKDARVVVSPLDNIGSVIR